VPESSVRSQFTITQLPDVAAVGSGQAHLAVGNDGTVVLNWLEPADETYALKFARFADGAWTVPQQLAAGSNWFINWADFPSVVPFRDGRWLAHWLVSQPDSFAYDVVTAVSKDDGRSWSEPSRLNDDGTETEHGFVSLFSWGEEMGAVWLDGRRLDGWTFEKELAAEVPLGVSLYYARMDADGRVLERGEIDELVCDCCQTDVAITARGPVLVYRDRTSEEVRDIVVRRHDGTRWLDAVQAGPDNFEIDGCPVNGPAIAARGEDVAVAWFTAPANQPKVRFARSSDAGTSFSAAIDLDTNGSFGQVGLVLLEDLSAVVSWWRRDPEGGLALTAQRIEIGGDMGPARVVARSGISQPIDVPQMVYTGAGFLFAWTSIDEAAGVHSVYVTGL
jgi:hypothetical protein